MDAPDQQPEETSEKPVIVLEFAARYSLLDAAGQESAAGEARLSLDDKSLGLKGASQKARYIPLRDILEINAADYSITLELSTTEKLTLSQMGHDYENFQRELALRRRDLTLSDLLMSTLR